MSSFAEGLRGNGLDCHQNTCCMDRWGLHEHPSQSAQLLVQEPFGSIKSSPLGVPKRMYHMLAIYIETMLPSSLPALLHTVGCDQASILLL